MDKFLPSFDRAYLEEKLYSYKEVNDGARNGLIISDFKLPEGKYTVSCSSLMIIIPQGYSDIPPDMFYFSPALTMVLYIKGNRVKHELLYEQLEKHSREEKNSYMRGRLLSMIDYIKKPDVVGNPFENLSL